MPDIGHKVSWTKMKGIPIMIQFELDKIEKEIVQVFVVGRMLLYMDIKMTQYLGEYLTASKFHALTVSLSGW